MIGEVLVPNKSFKDISGLVNSNLPQEELEFHIYDYFKYGHTDAEYMYRLHAMHKLRMDNPLSKMWRKVKIIPIQYIVRSQDILSECIDNFHKQNPESEGLMLRLSKGKESCYYPGQRTYGMQKIKYRDTLDLKVTRLIEALSTVDKTPLGYLGAIEVLYKEAIIKVSVSKMTLIEKLDYFNYPNKLLGKIAEVSYLPDESFNSLREAQFVRLREDKDTSEDDSTNLSGQVCPSR